MLKLAKEEIGILKKLIGYSFESLVSPDIKKSDINPSTYISLDLKTVICFDKNGKGSRVLIESDFNENEDGDVFYDYQIIQTDLSNYGEQARMPFQSSPIKEILVYGRKICKKDFGNAADGNKIFTTVDGTDDAFIFKCEGNQEILIYFHYFLPQLRLTSNSNEVEYFWRNFGEFYEKHLTIE